MTTAIICTGLLALLLFGLGFGVSMARGLTETNFGGDPNPTDRLYKMVRAHGNTAEYAPIFAVLFLFLGSTEPAPWIVWTIIAATVFRIMTAAGIAICPTLDKPHPLRFIGALGTYVTGITLGVATLMAT